MEIDDINKQNEKGWTALNLAVFNSLDNIAIDLIKKGADPNITEYEHNISPIYGAIRKNNKILINALLEIPNIDVNIQYTNGDTPVAEAIYKGLWEEVELMLKTADVNIYNVYSQTVFSLLVVHAPKELIVKAKNPDYNIQDNYGITPLHYLINKYYDSLEYFNLSSHNLDINIKDLNGNTPLSIAEDKDYLIQVAKKYSVNKIILDKDETVEYSTFTGSVVNMLSGLIYLQKNKEITTSFYHLFDSGEKPSLNVFIAWDNPEIYIPPKIDEMKKFASRFLVIPLLINIRNFQHVNVIIFDSKEKTIERFEPYGYVPHYTNCYNPDLLDKALKSELNIDGYTYLRPKDYQNIISFQSFETFENNKHDGEIEGYCTLWSIWYPYYRAKIELSAKELNKELVFAIRYSSNFRTTIRNFSKNITDISDAVLKDELIKNPKMNVLFRNYQ